MTIATKKEQEIAEIILKPNFPFGRFCRISEMLIRRMARRSEKIRLAEKARVDELNEKLFNEQEIEYRRMINEQQK